MKLAFSTDYWKALSYREFVTLAKELQFSGIEIHDIDDPAFCEKGAIFSDAMPSETRRLANLGISIPCIDTVFNIAEASSERINLDTLARYLLTAKRVRCPYVRLYAKAVDGVTVDEADEAAIRFLYRALPMAEKEGIVLLLETAGIYADTSRLAKVLGIFASDSLGALWDLSHPYRLYGEEPEKTVENLGAYIKHVHIKDFSDARGALCLPGEGDIPLASIMHRLLLDGYDGFFSLEWERFWHPELEDISVALRKAREIIGGL